MGTALLTDLFRLAEVLLGDDRGGLPGTTSEVHVNALRDAYDGYLRSGAETTGAVSVTHLGPLLLATFPGGRGRVPVADLGDADAATMSGWVRQVLDHFRADPAIDHVKWKTRGPGDAPGLHEALVRAGFTAGEPNSIMIGEAHLLTGDVPLPGDVTLRRITAEPDVRAMCAMHAEVFGDPPGTEDGSAVLLRRLELRDAMELWVAEAGGRIVAAGRVESVPGTAIAGLWGGSTRPEWRGRGLYRALTAARARAALAMGKRFVLSESTAYSRPILARAGLAEVATTTTYAWRR